MSDWVQTYDSSSPAFQQAFNVFLAHTDEKARIKEYLDGLIASLPSRRTLIDVGAGNGALTAWAGERFEKTIGIEPNASLRADLIQRCPHAEVLAQRIAEVNRPPVGDLILCSHVLYYIDRAEWLPDLMKMVGWLAPEGAARPLPRRLVRPAGRPRAGRRTAPIGIPRSAGGRAGMRATGMVGTGLERGRDSVLPLPQSLPDGRVDCLSVIG